MKILEIIFNYTHTRIHIYFFQHIFIKYQACIMLGAMKNTKLIKAMLVTFVGIKF